MQIPIIVTLLTIAGLNLSVAQPVQTRSPSSFAVGEVLEYGGSYKLLIAPISIGKVATLSVVGVDTIRGIPSWKFSFVTDFSALWFHNHSELISWTGVADFTSRRFVHKIAETNYSRNDDFYIFPDSGYYRNGNETTRHLTPASPVDDLAFIYLLRLPSTPLVVGQTYRLARYFRQERNPVTLTVLKREKCEMPRGVKSQCLVINPVVDDPPHGMFMKGKNAKIWITDDSLRIPVRIESGPFTLKLRAVTEPPDRR